MKRTAPDVLLLGATALGALCLLQLLWYGGWLLEPAGTRVSLVLLSTLPLLGCLWVCRRNLRRGVLIGGIICLMYFCHGVATAYADPALRAAGLVEVLLSLIVIATLGWDARHYRRAPRQR